MSTDALVTVATPSHFPLANLMMSSFARLDAGTSRFIYFLAGAETDLPESEHAVVQRVTDIRPPVPLESLEARYRPAEVCFALKPVVLRHALDAGFTRAHYLDSDLFAFASMAPLSDLLRQAPILLTPHRLTPARSIDDDLALLRAGLFNAGYLGVAASSVADRFLDWWWSRTERAAYVLPERALSGDQRWLDETVTLFPEAHVCRHPGANVGHWNLDERDLEHTQDGWRACRQPLLFFHFSAFEPASGRLSAHSQVTVDGVLKTLVGEYEQALDGAGVRIRSNQRAVGLGERVLHGLVRRAWNRRTHGVGDI